MSFWVNTASLGTFYWMVQVYDTMINSFSAEFYITILSNLVVCITKSFFKTESIAIVDKSPHKTEVITWI